MGFVMMVDGEPQPMHVPARDPEKDSPTLSPTVTFLVTVYCGALSYVATDRTTCVYRVHVSLLHLARGYGQS